MKIDEYQILQDWKTELINTERSNNTIKSYLIDVYYFLKFIEWDGTATKENLINYKRFLEKTLRPNTINRKIISITIFLKFTGADITVKQIKIQQKNTLENVLNINDYERIKKQAIKFKDEQMICILETLINTGLRASELLNMKVSDLDNNRLIVNNKGKIRYVPLRRELRKNLKEYCKEKKLKEYIFCNRQGNKISQQYISKKLKKYSGIARVKKSKAHLHSLRHLFACRYLETNNNIVELQNILGHSDLKTTSLYLQTSHEENVKKIEKLKML